nr:transposase [Thermus caliditerrae]
MPTSAILTLAILAAMELSGKHNKALALAKELRLFSHIPSPSRWNVASRLTNPRLHRAKVPLGPRGVYWGYIPSKRAFFHGLKLHLLVDDGKFVHELNLTPGSFHDLTSLLLLPLEVEEGKELYLDRGYESHLYEDLLREAQGVVPMVIRRRNSRRYVPWLQYLAILGRRVVETVGSMLHHLFLRRIHAVTPEGFVLKVFLFVLAHNLRLIAQKIA